MQLWMSTIKCFIFALWSRCHLSTFHLFVTPLHTANHNVTEQKESYQNIGLVHAEEPAETPFTLARFKSDHLAAAALGT